MAQLSAAEIAAQLGMNEDDPVVLEQMRYQDAAARAARRLGTGDARGTANMFSRRARRSATRDEPAPPPPTPKPKRSGDEAGCPGTAEKDDNRNSDAKDRKARRGALEASARHSQSFAGQLRDDDKENAEMAPPPPRPPPKARPPPPPPVATPSEAARRALDPSLAEAMDLGDTSLPPPRLPLRAPPPPPPPQTLPPTRQQFAPPPPPPSAPAEASRETKEMEEDEAAATDSGSELSLDPDQRYRELATTESLSRRSLSDVLRIVHALKPLVAAAKKPTLYAETCASLESGESVKASAVKLILSVVGVLSDDVVLAVFDGKEKDVAELAQLRTEALRADVTRAKEAKARAAQAALQAERDAAAEAPKTTGEAVSALNISVEARAKCSNKCIGLRSRNPESGCTCGASDTWSSSMKLVDIQGKKQVILHFDSGTPYMVYSLSALKSRFRPAGGGSGEEAVARLQEAARVARDKAGWKGDVNLASK